jgi:hypothetical protein
VKKCDACFQFSLLLRIVAKIVGMKTQDFPQVVVAAAAVAVVVATEQGYF